MMVKTVRSGIFRLLLCCLPYTLVGCAAIDGGMIESSTTDKTASSSFNAPATTKLGKTAASIAADHAGKSGFLLLDRGRDALSWRLILADAAEKSIDIQYFLWKNDAAGKVMMQRMLAAAARGVRIRVLIDDSMTEADPGYLALFGADLSATLLPSRAGPVARHLYNSGQTA